MKHTAHIHEVSPGAVAQSLTRDQLRLYTLIWNRFVASQMVPQLSQNTSALLQCGNFTLKANGTHVLFDGFTVVASSKDKEKEKEKNGCLTWLRDRRSPTGP